MKDKFTIIFLFSLIAGILVAVILIQLPADTKLWKEIANTGHVPLFGILSLVILELVKRLSPFSVTEKCSIVYSIAFVVTIFIGILVEISQFFGSRDADLYDLVRDGVGAISFLGVYATLDNDLLLVWRNKGRLAKITTRIISFSVFIIALLPIMFLFTAYAYRDASFPEICSCESYWETEFLLTQDAELSVVDLPVKWSKNKKNIAGKLELKPASYPGLWLYEPYPDWSQYEYLNLTIFSDEERSFAMSIRIHDSGHNNEYSDRFTFRFRIKTGKNIIKIPINSIMNAPASRKMDMRNISSIFLSLPNNKKLHIIYIDDIYLT